MYENRLNKKVQNNNYVRKIEVVGCLEVENRVLLFIPLSCETMASWHKLFQNQWKHHPEAKCYLRFNGKDDRTTSINWNQIGDLEWIFTHSAEEVSNLDYSYLISSNTRLRGLFNFEALRCDGYCRRRFNVFVSHTPFLYPLKTEWFSDVFWE